ncbi:hypothetical protein [Streptomyces sp. cg36]|uniref:hypothetical protein n=1 Tax=Streptomyces sp. cg36 TaxID=3238798 RepID=UPI0034E213AD
MSEVPRVVEAFSEYVQGQEDERAALREAVEADRALALERNAEQAAQASTWHVELSQALSGLRGEVDGLSDQLGRTIAAMREGQAAVEGRLGTLAEALRNVGGQAGQAVREVVELRGQHAEHRTETAGRLDTVQEAVERGAQTSGQLVVEVQALGERQAAVAVEVATVVELTGRVPELVAEHLAPSLAGLATSVETVRGALAGHEEACDRRDQAVREELARYWEGVLELGRAVDGVERRVNAMVERVEAAGKAAAEAQAKTAGMVAEALRRVEELHTGLEERQETAAAALAEQMDKVLLVVGTVDRGLAAIVARIGVMDQYVPPKPGVSVR